MNALTQEWVDKAEADFATALREVTVTASPNFDGVCFHAHQCVEKYLKAVLQEAAQPVPRTHDLPALLALVLSYEPSWQSFEPDLIYLTAFAVSYRYPGYSALEADGQRAVSVAERVRSTLRQYLGLP